MQFVETIAIILVLLISSPVPGQDQSCPTVPNLQGEWEGQTDDNTPHTLEIWSENENGAIQCSLDNEDCHGGISPDEQTIWIQTDGYYNYKRLDGSLDANQKEISGIWGIHEGDQSTKQNFSLSRQTCIPPPGV
jgi:hypothetical protein